MTNEKFINIYKAMIESDIDSIRYYLDSNNPKNEPKLPINEILWSVIRNKSSLNNKNECIRFLVENGADINIKDGYGESPLSYSIFYSDYANFEQYKFLIDLGAKVTDKCFEHCHWIDEQNNATLELLVKNQ